MEPTSGLIGDIQGTELPTAPLVQQEEAVNELKRKAKYSRSKEFSELKAKADAKIEYWQTYLPGGVPAEAVPDDERGKYWAIANSVIKELREVFDPYTAANEQVKELDDGSK